MALQQVGKNNNHIGYFFFFFSILSLNAFSQSNICLDIGVETGWNTWEGKMGQLFTAGSPTWTIGPQTNPPAPCFNLTSGTGTDPCTPGINPGDPAITLVAPGFGNSSMQIGEPQTKCDMGSCGISSGSAGCAEQLTFSFTVTAQDTNFIYAYALVFHDPQHAIEDKPYAEIAILDGSGNQVPCSYQHYTSLAGQAGFYQANPSCIGYPDTYYKPWTMVGVNLSSYIGQQITVVISNADCKPSGHFAHSYWDFSCGALSGNTIEYCRGEAVSLCAPSDPLISYTYQWYKNGNPYAGSGNASQCISPFPVPGDTFVAKVMQSSGCDFYMTYVPQEISVNAGFNVTGNCGNFNFTDASLSSDGSPVISWNWTFPGGSPPASSDTNPSIIYPEPGEYDITLITTAQNGCSDTLDTLFNAIPWMPVAGFTASNSCVYEAVQFTDSSVAVQGDAIAAWQWDFGDGSLPSATQNPAHVYAAPGNYLVTLIVTSVNGCTGAVSQNVWVLAAPVAGFTFQDNCAGKTTAFSDQSAGTAFWQWSFGDNISSAQQSPVHTYTDNGRFEITLAVTSWNGCVDTLKDTITIYPNPVPQFSADTVCLNDSTHFTDLTAVSEGTIVSWIWIFGDGSLLSHEKNSAHLYPSPGSWDVILIAESDKGCSKDTAMEIIVHPLPVADFTHSTVCQNEPPTVFTDLSTIISGDVSAWSWNFGDPASNVNSDLQNPQHNYASDGMFTVKLIVTSEKGCRDTVSSQVTVYPVPEVNFVADTTAGCEPLCVNFLDQTAISQGSITGWSWDLGNGNSSGQQNPSTCYNAGNYTISLTAISEKNCRDTLTKEQYITAFPLPKADFSFSPDPATIQNMNIFFSDLSSGDLSRWAWIFFDNDSSLVKDTSGVQNPSFNFAAAPIDPFLFFMEDTGFYPVQLIVSTKNGCTDTVIKKVKVDGVFYVNIPNAFTPNADGVNDFFFPSGIGILPYEDYTFYIFNRWGDLIYESHRLDQPWDGTAREQGGTTLVQQDVYVWMLEVRDVTVEHKKHHYMGHVTVVK